MKRLGSKPLKKVDNIDLQIINLLQENSRLSSYKIANKLSVTVSTVYNRIKSLEKRRILNDYTVLVDPDKLGYSLTAVILIQADGSHLVELEKEISEIENVISVYDITGDFDIIVIARFKDRQKLNHFIKTLKATPHIKRTKTNIVLNVMKEDFRVSLEHNNII